MTKRGRLFAICIAVLVCVIASSSYAAAGKQSAEAGKAKVSLKKIRDMRKQAAKRKRRIVFHSDGMAMSSERRFLESNESVLPFIPGTQTDACTYSLIHQFPVARLYRSEVAQEWPPGIIKKLYGDSPDELDMYIDFCRKNNYEAFWAMRMNDTHDCGDGVHGRRRWKSNLFKQAHPEFLVGSRDNRPPNGRWSALDYAHRQVRDKVFDVLEDVCQNYAIDGLMLDFFRHPMLFKSTVWGKDASEEELAKATALFRRIREMADEIGAKRGRPILLAVRTPDSAGYCKALGLDIERWMKDDLIDIWIVSGYFRLQEWKETARLARKYDIPVWASLDESRIQGRKGRNSAEAYRARAMNAWRAGVDSLFIFNFFYKPDDPQFRLLYELGDATKLAYMDKMYVPDARGLPDSASHWLKDGERFFTRPRVFSPRNHVTLKRDEPQRVSLLVGDDLRSAPANGFTPTIRLDIQAEGLTSSDDISVKFNNKVLGDCELDKEWLQLPVSAKLVKSGTNNVELAIKDAIKTKIKLKDLQLWITYERNK